jgi:hypothetical protein
LRDGEIEAIEGAHAAKSFCQGLGLDAKHGGTIAGTGRIANRNMDARARGASRELKKFAGK